MPYHALGNQKYCGQWSWNVGPQDTQECCCVYFADVRLSDNWVSSGFTNVKKWSLAAGYAVGNIYPARASIIFMMSLALRSTVQRFLFFSHWRRMINTKRLCFLENFWHFLIFFLYQVSPYQLKYKCHAFLTVFRLTFNSWSSDGFSQPKTTPSKKFFTSSPPNRARPKIPSLFPFCPNPTGKRIRRTRIHNQWLLLDFMYNLHTIVQSEWFVKRHLFVSKKDPECWLILFAQLYRIFFIDFRKYDPVSNFRLNRFLVAGLYCMWITTVSCNDKLFSVWNKLF